MKQLKLQDLAGYGSKHIAWRCLRDVSNELLEGGNTMPNDDNIIVDNDRFALCSNSENTTVNEMEAVWQLGASVFYVMMGSKVMKVENGNVLNLPAINPMSYGKELSQLLVSMLNPNADERPSLSQVKEIATKNCEISTFMAEPKRHTSEDENEEPSFWPEAMRRAVVLLLLITMAAGSVIAYGKSSIKPDAELSYLITLVKKLRQSPNNNSVIAALENDTKWTLMDEIKTDVKNECSAIEARRLPKFGLNDICRIAYQKRNKEHLNSGKRFHRGDDPNFRYSMIEITVHKSSTVTYVISGRVGEQLLAIMPYDSKSRLKAEVFPNIGISTSKDGDVQYINISRDLKSHDTFTLKVTNQSNKDAAFVLFNFNSQNQ